MAWTAKLATIGTTITASTQLLYISGPEEQGHILTDDEDHSSSRTCGYVVAITYREFQYQTRHQPDHKRTNGEKGYITTVGYIIHCQNQVSCVTYKYIALPYDHDSSCEKIIAPTTLHLTSKSRWSIQDHKGLTKRRSWKRHSTQDNTSDSDSPPSALAQPRNQLPSSRYRRGCVCVS